MKRILFLMLMVVFIATPVWAATFVNGGFETGDKTGWTEGGGSWGAVNYGYIYGGTSPVGVYYTGGALPVASDYVGGISNNTIVGAGVDPITGQSTVYNGSYAVRANDYVNDFSVSTIKQSVTNYTDNDIYFAWNAVLLASHGLPDSDYFGLTLRDDTTNTDMVSRSYSSASAPGIFTDFGGWYGSGWQVEHIDLAALGIVGHDFTLSLLASDCPYGGHAGYVYLDGFGAAPPVQGVPEPATVLLFGAGLAGLGFLRNRFKKSV